MELKQETVNELNQFIDSLMPRMPNMRYWQKKGDKWKKVNSQITDAKLTYGILL